MSFVRGSRSCPPAGRPGRKATRVRKKKAAGQQDWVSTIQDLQATRKKQKQNTHLNSVPKSSCVALGFREWKEQFRRKYRKHCGSPNSFSGFECSPCVCAQVLSEQYRMQDVLERSDRALAVVKDLFGDAPRRQTGAAAAALSLNYMHPSKYKMAQRIWQQEHVKCFNCELKEQAMWHLHDPRSDSSERRMEENTTCGSRYSRYLQEKETIGQQGRPGDQQHSLSHAPLAAGAPRSPHTPLPTAVPSGERAARDITSKTGLRAALNATAAVQRVRPRRQAAAPSPASPRHSPALVTHVLNPHPRPRSRAGKKSKPLGSSRRRCEEPPGLDSSAVAALSSNQSSLELLQSMLGEVEQELESLDHQDPHSSVAPPHRAPGLTGFSVSLVSTLRRLAQHLRQSDRALQGEMAQRRRLEGETREQRSLIDALTAEALALREENSAMQVHRECFLEKTNMNVLELHFHPVVFFSNAKPQVKLQQHIAATEQQLSSV
uniref:Spindle and centriole-associated protein 1 n=1 Tax=Lepisosteus oculatus TaxID=7918 RepID=W5M527_LEPOC